MQINYDANGFPILLSENGGTQNGHTAAAENDSGGGNDRQINTDPAETARRNDAVREVARRYKHGDTDAVVKYLEGRITRPLTVDELDSFNNDVHQHRVNDLVDIIDHHLRGSGVLTRSYRAVKVSAPTGWVQSMLENLADDDVISVARRLKHRGHDLADIQKFFGKRISKERYAKLEDKIDDDTHELNLESSGLGQGVILPEPSDIEPVKIPSGVFPDPMKMAEAIGRGIATALKEMKQ